MKLDVCIAQTKAGPSVSIVEAQQGGMQNKNVKNLKL